VSIRVGVLMTVAFGIGLATTWSGTASAALPGQGDRVIVARTVGAGDTDLYAIRAGGATRRLTDTPGVSEAPGSLSPDGSRVTYAVLQPSAQRGIWVVRVDGTGRRRVYPTTSVVHNPTWSADGRSISFVLRASGSSIASVKPDGTGVQIITSFTGMGLYPTTLVRAGDGRMVFTGAAWFGDDVYATTGDAASAQQLTDGPPDNTAGDTRADARRICFTSDRGGSVQVWTMRVDGTNPRQITDLTGVGAHCRYTDDGRIFFERSTGPGGSLEVYLIRADGTGVRRLTDNAVDDTIGYADPV
jgi:TolB protein